MKHNRFSRRAFLTNVHTKQFNSVFEAFLYSGRSTSLLRSNLTIVGSRNNKKDEEEILRCRFYEMRSRLRKDGLLSKENTLTAKGMRYISRGENNQKQYPKRFYEKGKEEKIVLVTFDIPEKKRGYRDWMRSALSSMGMEPLHKSVWVGKTAIPEDFLNDLQSSRLLDCVEILEISKKGTIKRLTKE